jgi:hypothetical protein
VLSHALGGGGSGGLDIFIIWNRQRTTRVAASSQI